MLFTDFRLAATCSLNRRNLSSESKGDLVAGDSTREGDHAAVAGVLIASFGVPAGVKFKGTGLVDLLAESSRDGVFVLAELGVRAGFNGELTEGVA
jgi:hypothetical protein